jgi:peptidoglycan/LPS O-acetylase OafA/YrhL
MSNLSLGVTLFFTLSGFLLYRPFAAAVLRGRPMPSLKPYFGNRALRLLPAYWVILVVVAATANNELGLVSGDHPAFLAAFVHPRRLIESALLVQSFSPHSLLTGIGPAWSLVVEVCFYLALPVLTMLALRIASESSPPARRRLAALVPPLLLLILGLSGKAIAAWAVLPGPGSTDPGFDPDWHSVIVRSILCQADLFSFGMILAILHVQNEDRQLHLPRRWRPLTAAVALPLIYGAIRLMHDGQLNYTPTNTVVALGMTLLLALVVVQPGGGRRRRLTLHGVLEARPLVAIGLASYSLYLWHHPLLHWLIAHHLTLYGRAGMLVNLLTVGALSGVLAALTYRFVERPALSRKRRSAAAVTAKIERW